jgi:hypothetical protein
MDLITRVFLSSNNNLQPARQTQGHNNSEIVNMLCSYLLHKSAELQAIVVEGFCKLMYRDKISEPEVCYNLIYDTL